MITDEDILQSEIESLDNKIKVFEEILNEELIDNQYEFREAQFYAIQDILRKYKKHFNLNIATKFSR